MPGIDKEKLEYGVSVLVEAKRKPQKSTKNTPSRLQSFLVFLLYTLLFSSLALALILIDGLPHWPERIWSWGEIWDKLTAPANGVSVNFWKYIACSLGWLVLDYLIFTVILELIVNLIYVLSIGLHQGKAGSLATKLKRTTTRITVSPLRRVLDGLILGAVFFTVVTTVAGGNQAKTIKSGSATDPSDDPRDYYQPVMVSEHNQASSAPSKASSTTMINSAKFNSRQQLLDQAGSNGLQYSNKPLQFAVDWKDSLDTNNLTHIVQPGDTLWSLAERYYGDGHLYPRIVEANLGQAMGNGDHFTQARIIKPGWRLLIPVITSPTPLNSYEVQPGDTLRKIAERLSGTETRWPEIWQLNVGLTMTDGRIAQNPDLIYPGWQLRLPESIHSPAPLVQSPSNPSLQSPAQPVNPTDAHDRHPQTPVVKSTAPEPLPSVNQTPSVTTPNPNVSGGVVTQLPGQLTPVTQNDQPLALNSDENWPWLLAAGVGGAIGLSFGFIKIGLALRQHRTKLKIKPIHRRWWQRRNEVNQFERESGPLLKTDPHIPHDKNGIICGFATTGRALELLQLRNEGFDADKPRLVLNLLQKIFKELGLPTLLPLSCLEKSGSLVFTFSGSPQDLSYYLNFDSLDTELEKADEVNLLYFPSSFYSTARLKNNLDETIAAQTGGTVSLEKRRDCLEITLEDLEFNQVYLPTNPSIKAGILRHTPPEGFIKVAPISASGQSVSNKLDESAVETEETEQEFLIYQSEKAYFPQVKGQPDGYSSLMSLFEPTQTDEATGQNLTGLDSKLETPLPELNSQNLFFPIGAATPNGEVLAASQELPNHFHLCLESLGHLLLIAGEGDEVARACLYSAIMQLCASAGPEELNLYLIGPALQSDTEAIQELQDNLGLLEAAGEELTEVIATNQQRLELLGQLPQVKGIINSDEFNTGGKIWRKGLERLLDHLSSLLIERRASLGNNKQPLVVILLADMPVIAALEWERLLQIFSEGPAHGIYVMACASYEGLNDQLSIPVVLAQEIGFNLEHIEQASKYFKSLGVFMAPTTDLSQKVWGTPAAAELSGYGEMLLKVAGKQTVRLYGFVSDEALMSECQELILKLWSQPLVVKECASEISPNQNQSSLDQFQPQLMQAPDLVKSETSIEQKEEISPEENKTNSEPKILFADSIDSRKILSAESIISTVIQEGLLTATDKNQTTPNATKNTSREEGILFPIKPENSIPVVQTEGQVGEIRLLINKIRWELYEQQIIHPALTLHLLHGFSVTFALRPYPQPQSTPGGAIGYTYPNQVDELKVYKCLVDNGLSFELLARQFLSTHEENFAREADRVFNLILELGINAWKKIQNPEILVQVDLKDFTLPQLCYWVQKLLQQSIYGFESVNHAIIGNVFPMVELQLLAYLALHPNGCSREKICLELAASEEEELLRKTLDTRLKRTRDGLEKALKPFLKLAYGKFLGDLETLVKNFVFIELDQRADILRLNRQLVWVDVWEFEQYLSDYRATPIVSGEEAAIDCLEKAFRLAEVTAGSHTDGQADSKMKLLGVIGDNPRLSWEGLGEQRDTLLNRWYELNLKLGTYYHRQLHQGRQECLEQAIKYYAQCHSFRPEIEETALGLMQLAHARNDQNLVEKVFKQYMDGCQQIELELDERVIAEYQKLGRRKAVRIVG